jgi:hypothetical protein
MNATEWWDLARRLDGCGGNNDFGHKDGSVIISQLVSIKFQLRSRAPCVPTTL